MARIAVAGFQHETNSFSPVAADYAAFVQRTSWPGMTFDDAVREAVWGMNLAIAGFLEAATHAGHATVPVLWANATPSGPVTDHAFETIASALVSRIAHQGPWDAVYLDLHGAMVTASYLDGEAEILRRIRAVIGEHVPLVVSLDLHANVSPEMVALADCLSSCQTYPHVDLADTGRRCLSILQALWAGPGPRPLCKAYLQPDYLIPIQAQTTFLEPAASLYEFARILKDQYPLIEASLTLGFGPSDTPHCGPAISVVGHAQDAVDRAARAMLQRLQEARSRFNQPLYSPEAAICRVSAMEGSGGPVVLADLQDNPGAGGTGDTTGLLSALAAASCAGCVLGVLYDPESAALAHRTGAGNAATFTLGGKRGGPGSVPYTTEARVLHLAQGPFRATGPMYGGALMDLGKMALLQLPQGPKVVIGSVNTHTADQSIFRQVGIDPATQKLVALKSAVHFRADFQPIAREILVVSTPGTNAADHHHYQYRNLRPGVQLMP